ncbi:MAG: pentapeptide repeat-containing protein [Synechococcaceae cyanobacterium]|nr:pentapeptide repeat-containing protein [Synechococcaceae cyanobacterium]
MRCHALLLALTLAVGAAGNGVAPAAAADTMQLMRLLEQRRCSGCQLRDADLVNADLRDADLRGADLRRGNLGQAQLDGANLGGADLRFTSLRGASLRGADLRGARLEGTDLRQSDLSGAQLEAGALGSSHWQGARGVAPEVLSYAELHNAGVTEALAGRQPQAEQLFSEAIRRQPEAAISWVARGISRSEQGNNAMAARDFAYASSLYAQGGDAAQAKALQQAAEALEKPAARPRGGNGMGGALLSGAASVIQGLAPLAMKFLVPALGL